MRKHYTKAQRAALIELVSSGKAQPRPAANQVGVTESTAYYWLRRAGVQLRSSGHVVRRASTRASTSAPATFARLVRAADVPDAITVRVGDAAIELRRGFDPALLREVVAAVTECGL